MKAFATFGTSILLLFLGTIVPAFAQHDQGEAKPEQQQHAQPEQQQHAQPEQQQHAQQQNQQKQQHAQPEQQQHAQQQNQQNQQNQQQQQHAQQQNQQKQRQGVQQAGHQTQQQQRVQQSAWQGHRSQNWQSDHRTWQQRGGYKGYRIPDNHYNPYFGRGHAFVIFSQPYMVVGGFPRFQYGGYWFTLVDPWPGDWANNWYETDDVYIVYENDGYYMYNQRYPGVGIAINVSF